MTLTAVEAPGLLVEARRVSRQFGSTCALDEVSLQFGGGIIHALVGENGAGKSTLLGILAGRVPASTGHVFVDEREMPTGSPRLSRAHGIVAIYQELTTVPALTAYENVFLGQILARGPFCLSDQMRQRFVELASELGVSLRPDARAGDFSVADRQVLEIMRALQASARALLFDEPTAALAPKGRDGLFGVMRQLRARGKGMLFVSHQLEEVLDIADAVSVFRDGRVVDTRPVQEWTKAALVSAMLGGAPVTAGTRPHSGPKVACVPLLTARQVAIPGLLYPVDLEVRKGEVLGVAGLVGSGRTSLLRALAGAEPKATGTVEIDGRQHPTPRSPREALGLGIALIPEDRKHQGIVSGQSSATNVVLSSLGATARHGLISPTVTRQCATKALEPYAFKTEMVGRSAGQLSGGNQQKLLLGRWRHRPPRILLADEPTRGIDVGAKAEILTSLMAAARDGLAVVVVSSEMEEVLAVADRILVLSNGRLVAELGGAADGVGLQLVLQAAFQGREGDDQDAESTPSPRGAHT